MGGWEIVALALVLCATLLVLSFRWLLYRERMGTLRYKLYQDEKKTEAAHQVSYMQQLNKEIGD